jgi:hypothetical protein
MVRKSWTIQEAIRSITLIVCLPASFWFLHAKGGSPGWAISAHPFFLQTAAAELSTPIPGDSKPLGEIRGSIRITSSIPSKSMAVRIYPSPGTPSPPGVSAPASRELENVVVYLEGKIPSITAFPQSPRRPSMRQVNETFVPHVLAIMAGTTVDFPNGDPFFHNVFSLSGPKSFDLGRYPQGQKRSIRFDHPGLVKVFCHIHSNMSAVIWVFAHPYFTVPDKEGHFLLSALPPGEYQLVAWHERLKPFRKAVSLRDGETVNLEIVL